MDTCHSEGNKDKSHMSVTNHSMELFSGSVAVRNRHRSMTEAPTPISVFR